MLQEFISPVIDKEFRCNFIFVNMPHRIHKNTNTLYDYAIINLLKPNDIYIYICRTAALTSRRYILNIYSTNTHTEYFKHAA